MFDVKPESLTSMDAWHDDIIWRTCTYIPKTNQQLNEKLRENKKTEELFLLSLIHTLPTKETSE